MRKLLNVFLFLGTIGLLVSNGMDAEAQTIEARCTALGANCVCSEPFNATMITSGHPTAANWDTNVVKVKPCDSNNGGGAPVVRNIQDIYMASSATDPAMFAAMPAAHTITRVMSTPTGSTGTFEFCQQNTGPTNGSKHRLAQRYYRYVGGTVFQSGNYGLKIFFVPIVANGVGGPTFTAQGTGGVHYYPFLDPNIATWSTPQDCCIHQCAPPCISVGSSYWNGGKWFRLEAITINPGGDGVAVPGQGPVFKLYAQDITTPGAQEILLADTSAPNPGGVAGGGNFNPTTQNMKYVNGVFRGHWPSNYRESPSSGQIASALCLAASWDTDANQRIGPAVEMEGAAVTPPATPTGLQVQ